MSSEPKIKKGDKMVVIGYGHRDAMPIDVEVVAVGPKWITVSRAVGTSMRFSAERVRGSHYGDYGSSLWPSREAYAAHVWDRQTRQKIADAVGLGGAVTTEQIREIAKILGLGET